MLFNGTPESIIDIEVPHTVAIEEDPLILLSQKLHEWCMGSHPYLEARAYRSPSSASP